MRRPVAHYLHGRPTTQSRCFDSSSHSIRCRISSFASSEGRKSLSDGSETIVGTAFSLFLSLPHMWSSRNTRDFSLYYEYRSNGQSQDQHMATN